MKTHTILCPVDFSKCSEWAIEVAAKLAHPESSKVILLNVVDPSKPDSKARSIADQYANDARAKIRDHDIEEMGIEIEHLNLRGNPAEMIIQVANQKKVDLIVMGTHGRSGWSKLMLGSTAQQVMKDAACPIITVRPQIDELA